MTEPMTGATTPESTQAAGTIEMTAPRRRKGVALAAVGGTIAAVALATGGALAFNALSGGGPQPEDVVPADAIAFAKIDLDPSSGQKISAVRLMRKFPALKEQLAGTKDDVDLRRLIVEAAQKDGALKNLSYDTDIAPWVGERFAAAAVRKDGGTDIAMVMLIASTDEAKARAAVAKAGAGEGVCDVVPNFVRCAETTEDLAAFAAGSKTPLVDAKGFSSDMSELGEDGIVSMWADIASVFDISAAAQPETAAELREARKQLGNGRLFGALRFDGTNVELVGGLRGLSLDTPEVKGSPQIGALPGDTMAAISMAGVGQTLKSAWAQLETGAGGAESLGSLGSEFGLSLPDDLIALLGEQTTLALGGIPADGAPKIALKTDGDQAVATKLMTALADQGQPLASADTNGGVVLALDQAYADEVATGSGLDKNPAFVAAMPDHAKATSAFFVDIAKIVEAFGADIPADIRENLSPLSALGATATQSQSSQDFTVRLTTQ